MQHKTLAFIGAGNMSRSIISGLINAGYPSDKITASNPSTAKLDELKTHFAIHTSTDNIQTCQQAEVIVLAVKPQIMAQVTRQLQQHCQLQDKLFISIAAGISISRLQQMLGGTYALVRTMPNTPSALGKGMTGLFANNQVTAAEKVFAGQMMAAVGEILWLQEEQQIDGVIAAAGSSPAYFFLFLEAMEKETQAMGFDPQQARLLVQQAMLGAAQMVCHNPDLELSELRAQVTSKGGATAQAIDIFQQQQLDQTVAQAMRAAVKRAQQMSELF